MKKHAKGLSLYAIIIIFLLFVILATRLSNPAPSGETYTYTDMLQQITERKVTKIQITPDTDIGGVGRARVFLPGGRVENVEVPHMGTFMEFVHNAVENYDLQTEPLAPPKTSFIFSFLPFLLIMVVTILLFMFVMQQMQGGAGGNRVMSFGKSKARVTVDEKRKVTFDQVAGLLEEKAELQELVEFLKQPKKFVDIGARIPKGVLLVGPPGTGKTLLARAVAGEAGVPFFSISGSDFVEMFVGVGASRVRDLFEQAKKNSPCIVFIDEIDAVGRRRGAGLGGGHDEREQTLNQLLVEMDGFGINEGVIIIAATNRPDILDPALLRPGRFDRRVVVGRPDVKGREEILQVHAKGKIFSKDVDLKVIAQTTAGFTGADLENLLNEGALLAARDNKKEIEMDDLRRAFVKVGIGTEKKSRVITPQERRITAYHEAGHAILFEILSELDPVHIISIIPTGLAGGYTMPLPGEDRSYITKRYMEQSIVSLLGGRAAEFIVLQDITTGASNDIERATATARNMVVKYGMSDLLGPIQFGDENQEIFIGRDLAHTRNYGEQVASQIDSEIKRIVEDAYQEAIRLITLYIDVLHAAAELLIKQERVTGQDFRALFPEGVLTKKHENTAFVQPPFSGTDIVKEKQLDVIIDDATAIHDEKTEGE